MTDGTATLRVVHEGRGGYIEIEGVRYAIEHVEGGRFAVHVPRGSRAPHPAHLAALAELCAREPERWTIER